MFNSDAKSLSVLLALGDRLRIRRLMAKDSQQNWATKLHISVPTYRKLEKGDPGVPVGYWLAALHLLDELEKVDQLIVLTSSKPPEV